VVEDARTRTQSDAVDGARQDLADDPCGKAGGEQSAYLPNGLHRLVGVFTVAVGASFRPDELDALVVTQEAFTDSGTA
jgi:hypothetical protein